MRIIIFFMPSFSPLPAKARLSERREEKIKEMKSKYEHQLADMKRELKQLQLAKKEHSKAMKKNVRKETDMTMCMCMHGSCVWCIHDLTLHVPWLL